MFTEFVNSEQVAVCSISRLTLTSKMEAIFEMKSKNLSMGLKYVMRCTPVRHKEIGTCVLGVTVHGKNFLSCVNFVAKRN